MLCTALNTELMPQKMLFQLYVCYGGSELGVKLEAQLIHCSLVKELFCLWLSLAEENIVVSFPYFRQSLPTSRIFALS